MISENFSFVGENLDCTHGAFRTPTENKAAFRGSKWFHSINVQVICDAHYSITNVMANISWACHVFNVLQNIVSSSACTVPDWKRQPLGFILFISQILILKQKGSFHFLRCWNKPGVREQKDRVKEPTKQVYASQWEQSQKISIYYPFHIVIVIHFFLILPCWKIK